MARLSKEFCRSSSPLHLVYAFAIQNRVKGILYEAEFFNYGLAGDPPVVPNQLKI